MSTQRVVVSGISMCAQVSIYDNPSGAGVHNAQLAFQQWVCGSVDVRRRHLRLSSEMSIILSAAEQ